ncbi:hypothetical protein AMECASPLE_023662 [Ameca splendens]|uniref:Uncharacterized protein n=1 Tax=Ameca splendens TaxID=208324 RepID=A0ABV0XT91_9TELE
MELRSRLCVVQILTLLSFVTNFAVMDGPICAQTLTSWLISRDLASTFPHNAKYIVKITSPSFSETSQQHDAASSHLVWCSQAYRLPRFPLNVTRIITAKHVHYSFDVTQGGSVLEVVPSNT